MMRDILGNDVPWYTIRDWIRGRRRAPEWARDRVAAALYRNAAELRHRLAMLETIRVQKVKIRDLSR